MSKTSPAGRSRPSLPDLDFLATKSRLVIRKSPKFSPGAFLQSLLGSVVTGLASLNQIAASLGSHASNPMSRQSLHGRFDFRSTAFLMAVLCDLMEQRFRAVRGEFDPRGPGRNGTNLSLIWDGSGGLKSSSRGVVLSGDDSSWVCVSSRGVPPARGGGERGRWR